MKSSDSAVSEVVGVLLMLTVTLILVSLVAISMNSAVSSPDKPVSATIVGSLNGNNVTFETIAGDSFDLNRIEVRLGIREQPENYTTLRNEGSTTNLYSYSDTTLIGIGDRFRIESNYADHIGWDTFNPSGLHLTYRIYDRSTGSPVSSGEIAIP